MPALVRTTFRSRRYGTPTGPRRARALLAKYADEDVLNFDDARPCSSFKAVGGKDEYVAAVQAMQSALYQEPA
jgi:hypothetical protein